MKADKEMVKDFLKRDEPEKYDFKMEYKSPSEIQDDLERFMVHKFYALCGIDPDKSKLTMSIMCLLLEMKGYDVKGYEGRYIYLNDSDVDLETDTANSFLSLYKGALKSYVPAYEELCDEFEINTFTKDFEKFFENRYKFTLKGFNDDLLKEFEKFARLTHTIGNFILGPKGFNCSDPKAKSKVYPAKHWRRFDRMDLFLGAVAEGNTHDEWKRWFEGNIYSTYLEDYFETIVFVDKSKTRVDLKKSILKDLESDELINDIALINQLIIGRGERIISDLRLYLGIS